MQLQLRQTNWRWQTCERNFRFRLKNFVKVTRIQLKSLCRKAAKEKWKKGNCKSWKEFLKRFHEPEAKQILAEIRFELMLTSISLKSVKRICRLSQWVLESFSPSESCSAGVFLSGVKFHTLFVCSDNMVYSF